MSASSGTRKNYRYYDLVMASFVAVLLCSNLIGATKLADFWGWTSTGAVLFFPLSYIFGDILTEVYGYARTRKVVWAGFGAMIFASLMAWLVLKLPPAKGWPHQAAVETIFGTTWRITLGSLIAYFVGELVNSFVLAKMKIWTKGKRLWTRTIGSTIFGQFVDSLIFYPIAFYGVWPNEVLIQVTLTNYLVKVAVEVLFTPVTYGVVGFLKKAESEDFYDRGTDFTPFSLKT